MKLKLIYNTLICFLCFGLLFSIFINEVSSQEENYEISISNKSYEIVEIDESHGIIKFDIMITLTNLGTVESDNITIRIMDEDNVNLTKKYTFMSGESNIFIFEDHPLIGLKDHEIKIYYYPTEAETYIPDTKNHGEDILVLKYATNNGENNTPGFEILISILSVTLIITIKKIKKL